MFLAFVAAMGNVGLEDVAVAGLQFLQDGAFVDDAGAAVIGECAKKNGVLAVFGIISSSMSMFSLPDRIALTECLRAMFSISPPERSN